MSFLSCTTGVVAQVSEHFTDQQLVDKVKEGDKKAFNLLVLKYQNRVTNIVSGTQERKEAVFIAPRATGRCGHLARGFDRRRNPGGGCGLVAIAGTKVTRMERPHF